ncbi:MAG: hypothetical protein IT556_00835 [Acetobacteraceae bacterium]|nr:hypothetical protein [Acetobacteraceae bacterium]
MPSAAAKAMARRRIGQEDLMARPEPRGASSLSELSALLARSCPAAEGEVAGGG